MGCWAYRAVGMPSGQERYAARPRPSTTTAAPQYPNGRGRRLKLVTVWVRIPPGALHPWSALDSFHDDRSIGTREALEVADVGREHDASTALDRGGDHVGIGEVLGACACRGEHSSDEPGHRAVGVAQLERLLLSGEQRIDQMAATGTAIELGEDDGRNRDIATKAMGCGHRSSNLSLRGRVIGGKDAHGLRIEDEPHDAPPRSCM